MKFQDGFEPSLAGSLLVAHPALIDPNFRKSVVLLSAHTWGKGGLGVVINHPMNKTVGDYDRRYINTSLGGIPLFDGGPIGRDQIILTAWEWLEKRSVFKFHFGIPVDKAMEMMKDPNVEVKAFLGYTGWTHGQLERELEKKTWLLSSVKNLMNKVKGNALWKRIVLKVNPEFKIFVDTPDDLSVN